MDRNASHLVPVVGQPEPSADHATRCLAAAVHLDQPFCEEVVQEYLAEPRRALPPSSGVDVAAVLREALAARRRRKIRDWTLLALLAMFVFTNFVLFAMWLLAAIMWRSVYVHKSFLDIAAKAFRIPRSKNALVKLFVISILAFAGLYLLLRLAVVSINLVTAFLLAVMMFAVVLADRVVEWWLATLSFAKVSPPSGAGCWPGELRLRSLGATRFAAELAEVERQARTGNLIIFRGREPFVGSGERYRSWEIAIPLVPAGPSGNGDGTSGHELMLRRNDDRPGPSFTPMDVYRYIFAEFENLRTALSLAPSRRLSSIQVSPLVVAAAEGLLDNYGDPRSHWVLPDLNRRPNSVLSLESVEHVADEPVEWMRHFQRIQIESWDQELVVSAFLHVGCDRQMLYIEWNYHVLFPISRRYRMLDQVPASGLPVFGLAIADLLALPASIIERTRSAMRRITLARSERPRQGWVGEATYGAWRSVREMAGTAAASVEAKTRSYFEATDIERYSEILERHTFGSIAGFLESRGLSTRELGQRAMNVINNYGGNAIVSSPVIGNTFTTTNNNATTTSVLSS